MKQLFWIVSALLVAIVAINADPIKTPHQPVVAWYVNHDLKHWETVDKTRITHLFFSDRHIQVENDSCFVEKRKLDEAGGINEDYALPKLIEYREQYKFKIVLMLGGWGGSNFFGHCAHESRRTQFIESLVQYLDEYNFDGVDLDWEHIGIGGACDFDNVFDPENPKDGCFMTKEQIKQKLEKESWTYHYDNDWESFLALIRELRVKLNELETKKSRQMLITSAMSISGQAEGCQGRVDGIVYKDDPTVFRHVPCKYPDWLAICDGLDLLNVMVYDVWGPWYDYTGHHAPFDCDEDEPLMKNKLSPPFTEPCKPRFTAKNAVSWFIQPNEPEGGHQHQGGCPREKILLGMPLYGKSLCETDGLYQKGKPCDDKTPGFEKIHLDATIKSMHSHGYYLNTPQYFHNATSKDGRLIASYYYNPDTRHYVTYDSPELIFEKTKYAAEENIGGYFFWSAEMDFGHLAAEKALAGWYAGKGKPLPDGVNLDGETFPLGKCAEEPNSSASSLAMCSSFFFVGLLSFFM